MPSRLCFHMVLIFDLKLYNRDNVCYFGGAVITVKYSIARVLFQHGKVFFMAGVLNPRPTGQIQPVKPCHSSGQAPHASENLVVGEH